MYGGLVMTDGQLVALSDAVAGIRERYGYQRGDKFKFQASSRPENVTPGNATAAKREAIAVCESLGVRMIVYVILHNIAPRQGDETTMNYALNTVTAAYHRLLERERATGVFLIDREDAQHAHQGKLFQHGFAAKGLSVAVDDRIKLFGMTSNNASHVSSAVDIAVGGFRYCVNAAGGAGNEAAAASILPPLYRMMWDTRVGSQRYVREHGFLPRPEDVRAPSYADLYRGLYAKLGQYGTTDPAPEAVN